jgi:primosomal protein N' (replication factor Y) (superfamily II helicase)
VVPDVPSFSVDDGFAYRIPPGLPVTVGSIVRVPLGGRRVRGWVVSIGEPDRERLRDILGVSGDLPVFDRHLLDVLRWAASRYVAPLASLLAKATPPNLPRIRHQPDFLEVPPPRSLVLPDLAAGITRGGRSAPTTLVGPGPWVAPIQGLVATVAGSGQTSVVIAATFEEAVAVATGLTESLGDRVVLGSSRLTAAKTTAAWERAATRPGTVLVGTREVGLWPWAAPGLAVLIGEGRRGMKDKATPTVHAREVVVKRSTVERFSAVFCDLVPSAEAITRSVEVTALSRRSWGHVEVVDRREDAPGSGLFSTIAAAAMRSAVADGRKVLLFTDRRVAAQRCVKCRRLRRCARCGAGPGAGEVCARCGSEVGACEGCGGRRFEALGSGAPKVLADAGRLVGRDKVGEVGSSHPVVVGTERDLPGLEVDLTIVIDADGPILAPHYRAAEDALRLLARAVAAAGTGRGRRAIIQTVDPDHPVVRALRQGDPIDFVRGDADRRASMGFPPGGEVVALEASGLQKGAEDDLLGELGGRADVHGPAPSGDGLRWLLQGRDLTAARTVLRGVVGRWRESGARVRVDSDPIEL